MAPATKSAATARLKIFTLRLRRPALEHDTRSSASQHRRGRRTYSSLWLTTLITLPSGARTKNLRTPQGSSVSGWTISYPRRIASS